MNLKSVLLSAPIRVGGAPAAKKYEHGGDVRLIVDPPFVVVGRRVGDIFQSVGVPITAVAHVEFGDEPLPSIPAEDSELRTRKRKTKADGEQGEGQ